MVTYKITDGAEVNGTIKGKRKLLRLLSHPDYAGKSLQISLSKRKKSTGGVTKPNSWVSFLMSTRGKKEFLSKDGKKDLKKVREAYLKSKKGTTKSSDAAAKKTDRRKTKEIDLESKSVAARKTKKIDAVTPEVLDEDVLGGLE